MKTKQRQAKTRASAATTGVMAWQDDPISKMPALAQPVPDLKKPPLRFKIKGPALKPGIYPAGSPGFRYWAAAEALRRGGDFWAPILGVKSWEPGPVLQVGLDGGVDFNAYYDRTELAFFHDTADGQIVYSGESPDIVCHEMGHACLDAYRPQLWDTPFIEAGAFHESFGDMSAILSASQLPSVRTAALSGVAQGKPSFLSRLAEQLGWAIRQSSPDAVDSDCLRNACNSFHYVDPNTLPDSAPADKLCAEVHSFSRIFTGAFYEILSGMLDIRSKKPTEDDLAAVALDWALLLLDATAAAPVRPDFFAQVASHVIDADTVRFHGKYRKALTDTFVARKIIPASSVQPLLDSKSKLSKQALAFAAHVTRPAREVGMHKVNLPAKDFGLPAGDLVVQVPLEQKPALMVSSTLLHGETANNDAFEQASHRFVSMLFAHDRIDTGNVRRSRVTASPQRGTKRVASPRKDRTGEQLPRIHTHALVKAGKGLRLVRRLFVCGCLPR